MQTKEIKSNKIIVGHVKYRNNDMVAEYSVEVTKEKATCEEVAELLVSQADGAEIIAMCVHSKENVVANFEEMINHIIEDISKEEANTSAKGKNKDGK